MKKEAGLWIDHRQAVIVIITDDKIERKHIISHVEKHVRYSGASERSAGDVHDDGSESRRDRQYKGQLNRYYDDVMHYLDDVMSLLIIGPGEAKDELQKRLNDKGFGEQRIVAVQTADKMTHDEIVVAVQQYFYTVQHSPKTT